MRAILRIALFSLFICCCCACGQKTQTEKEPNDAIQSATLVSADAPVRGDLSGAEDRDYLRVAVPAGQLFSFILEHAPDTDFVVEAYRAGAADSADGAYTLIKRADGLAARRFTRLDPQAKTVAEHISFLDSGGKDIILLIRAASKEGVFPAAWRLTMELTADDGRVEREPNDSPDGATPLIAGQTIEGRYSPAVNTAFADGFERDFYQYVNSATNRVTLELEVSGVPDVDAVLEIYDDAGRVSRIIDAAGVHYGETSGRLGLETSMTCTFALRAKTPGQGNPRVSYRLRGRVSDADPNEEFEPNDDMKSANLLIPGEAMRARIFPEGDTDYFRLPLPAAAGRYTISARLAPDGDADLTLQLVDAAGRVLLTVDDEPAGRAEYIANYGFTAPRNGELYCVVRAKPGTYSDPGYSIVMNYHPAGAFAEFESNDTPATANPLTLGVDMRGYFFPAGDQDWFSFDLEEESILDMRLMTPAGVRAGMRLESTDGQTVAKTPSFAAGEVRLRTRALPAGRYFLMLAAEDAANPRDPWILRVTGESN